MPSCMRYCSSFELGFITDNEAGGDGVSHAQEMRIVFIERADGQTAWFKTKPFVVAGFAQDKEGPAFDLLLPQGKSEQFSTHPLLLKFG